MREFEKSRRSDGEAHVLEEKEREARHEHGEESCCFRRAVEGRGAIVENRRGSETS
jgi:hypothetical protein